VYWCRRRLDADAGATSHLHDTGEHSKIFKVGSASVSKLFRESFRVFSLIFWFSRYRRAPKLVLWDVVIPANVNTSTRKTGYDRRATRMGDNKWLFRAELTTVLFAARSEDRQQKEEGWNGFTERHHFYGYLLCSEILSFFFLGLHLLWREMYGASASALWPTVTNWRDIARNMLFS